MLLCEYRDVFGAPNTGFHARRIAGLALWDVVGTLVLAWPLARWTSWPYVRSLAFLLVLGILLHWVFCVPTKLNRMLKLA